LSGLGFNTSVARENRSRGYDGIVDARGNLGYHVTDQTVGNVLRRRGIVSQRNTHPDHRSDFTNTAKRLTVQYLSKRARTWQQRLIAENLHAAEKLFQRDNQRRPVDGGHNGSVAISRMIWFDA
jgi:hypothetical protein